MLSIAVRPDVSGFVPLSVANRVNTGWLKIRVLKLARELSLVVTFVTSERARPNQIANLIKELYSQSLYSQPFRSLSLFISSEQRVYWLAERQSLKLCTKIIICF